MTKTLTEQWREGTLPKGLYYTRSSNGRKGFSFHTGSKRNMFSPYDRMAHQVEEVLGPVPDYMDYKGLIYDSINMDKAKIKVYELVSKTERLEKRLEIATKALKEYADSSNWYETDDFGISAVDQFACDDYGYNIAQQALKEMEGVK